MKPKVLRKKLTLKKQTISHLEAKQQDDVRGGGSETCVFNCTNYTCYLHCGSYNTLCFQASECGYTCDNAC